MSKRIALVVVSLFLVFASEARPQQRPGGGPEQAQAPARRSTLVASQLTVSAWHEMIGDRTLADTIMDRLVHQAYQLNLKGESMRKKTKSLIQAGH